MLPTRKLLLLVDEMTPTKHKRHTTSSVLTLEENSKMNSKQLAEMVKHLRKVALNELQARSRPTNALVATKLPSKRKAAHERGSQPLSGRDQHRRYKQSPVVETELNLGDKKTKKKNAKDHDTINFEPQQSDEKIF
jgi:hypothetical protein